MPSVAASPSVTLTFWTWVPQITQYEIPLFEKAYPNVTVNVVNAGQGAPEYTKLRTALKAGSGAPDAVQIEYQLLPTFEATKDLVDLSKYGAGKQKSKFAAWTWKQVSRGSHVYAIPQDAGPMGLLYRRDIFQKYHLAVPRTWAQFASEAKKLHAANPKISITNMPTNDPGEITGLMWQAGSRPFHITSGNTIKIALNDTPAMKVAKFWGDLVAAKAVADENDFTPSWYKHMSDGTYAGWVTAAWGPVFLQGIAKNTSGKWGAASLPQWNAGKFVTGNWGGSTTAVTTQSSHPKEAAELAMFINSNRQSAQMFFSKQFFWPTLDTVLHSKQVLGQTFPFYHNQRVGRVFAKSSNHVDLHYQWSPFQDYVYTEMTNDFGAASSGDWTGAMNKVQQQVVSFAKLQGYTVQ
jgi:multiple sugar transport system substrate-binding protein